ncbi:TY-Chap domain-containing protein [Gordonia malaquae]|uniref:TY-Chap domain-containing protein n=1 Tax=Gordonia malaquae TaxID=410332 RepID=UPI0030FE02E7
MTDPITENISGFDESAFDAELDGRWRGFRIRLADYLSDLTRGYPFSVYDAVANWSGMTAQLEAAYIGDDGLALMIEVDQLSADEREQAGRVRMLRDRGWRRADDTLIIEFERRHVDEAAIAVEYALREVWGVPDPAYLLADENDMWREFT